MTRLYVNNYTSTLALAISDSDTTIVVTNASQLPTITGSDYYHLTIAAGPLNEIVKVTARTGTSLTVTRAQEGTAALAWATGDIISLRETAASFSETAAGAASSTDNALARFDGTSGKSLQNSVVFLSDTGALTGITDITASGAVDLGGATSFELPNSATPTVNADGEIALDTTVSDFSHGVVKYYGGEELGVVAMPIAQFTSPSDGYVVTYDATNDEFKLAAGGGGGGGSPGGSDTQMQYNDGGSFGGDSGMTTDGAGNVDIVGSLDVDNISLNGSTITTSSGDLVISANSGNSDLSVAGTRAFGVPVGTTGQRPASPIDGMIRYNSSLARYEGVAGSSWTGGKQFVIVGDFASSVTIANNDKVLIQDTSNSDAFAYITTQNIRDLSPSSPDTVANGGTGRATATAYAPIVGGTTSTGAHQSASAGSTGQVFQSNGSSAIPSFSTATYPSTASTAGKILMADGTNWVAKGGKTAFHASCSTNQTISTTTATKIQLNTEALDTGNYFDNATNYRYTPLIAGKYYFYGNLVIDSGTGAYPVIIQIYKNGAAVNYSRVTSANSTYDSVYTGMMLDMNGSTDYVELYAFHNAGANKNLLGGTLYCYMGGLLMEPA